MKDEDIIICINYYFRNDFEKLEEISEKLGVDVSIWNFSDWHEDSENIDLAKEVIRNISKGKSKDEAESIVSILKRLYTRDLPEDGKLPFAIYKQLGELISNYSSHQNTRTVYWKKDSLLIRSEDAYPSSSKDTYNENDIVARNYSILLNTLIQFAQENRNNEDYLIISAHLYRCLTSLSEDYCNQQNAVDFARLLLEFNPLQEQP